MRSTDGNDNSRHFFRSQERLFCLNGKWYFATREGDCGPFPTKDIARAEISRYIADRKALIEFRESRRDSADAQAAADPGISLVPMD